MIRRSHLPRRCAHVSHVAAGQLDGARRRPDDEPAVPVDRLRDPLERGAIGEGDDDARADELPETGTSLALAAGRPVDRAAVLLQFLRTFEHRYLAWAGALGDPVSSGLARDYLAWCSTIGAQVVVTLPDGSTLEGAAESVDWDGRLVVRTPQGTVELASGDVRHLRGRM